MPTTKPTEPKQVITFDARCARYRCVVTGRFCSALAFEVAEQAYQVAVLAYEAALDELAFNDFAMFEVGTTPSNPVEADARRAARQAYYGRKIVNCEWDGESLLRQGVQ